jgi:hypothetical protein
MLIIATRRAKGTGLWAGLLCHALVVLAFLVGRTLFDAGAPFEATCLDFFALLVPGPAT